MEWTNGQKEVLTELPKWFNSIDSKQMFEIAGYAGCLDENSYILTDKGTITLKELILMEENNLDFKGFRSFDQDIKVYNGYEFTDISKIYATDIIDGYEIITKSGLNLRVSSIHPLMVKNKWKKACDLQIGDKIASLGRNQIYKNEELILKNDDYFFLGCCMSHAYYYDDNQIILHSYKKSLLITIQKYLKRRFNIEVHDDDIKNEDDIYNMIFCCNDEIISLVNKIGLLCGHKFINSSILDDPIKKFNFLRGISQDYSYYSEDEENLKLFQILMREFGINFSIKENNAILDNYNDVTKFEKLFINSSNKKLLKKNRSSKKFNYDEIVEIKEIRQKFYDITVPNNHSFVSNSFISHNTGKSTIVNECIRQLGLNPLTEVAFATFTGKAALVLTLKGCRATTIHQLIYQIATEAEPLYDKDGNPILDEFEQPILSEEIHFTKKKMLDDNLKLIVIDECSMIDQKMLDDLKSFNLPILVLGDPFQLGPIYGNSILLQNPDIFLTEIMRTKEDDPIVYLSKLVREGKILEEGKYGRSYVINRKEFDNDFNYNFHNCDKILTSSDIVICRTNRTRTKINNYFRKELYGIQKDFPTINDKMICRRNNWEKALTDEFDINLVNGLIGTVVSPITRENINSENCFYRMDFRPEMCLNDYFENLPCSSVPFNNYSETDKKIIEYKQWKYFKKKKESCNLFEYAYAITAHLSQGSSWGRVLVYDEHYGKREDYLRSLYTSITRAEKQVIIGVEK